MCVYDPHLFSQKKLFEDEKDEALKLNQAIIVHSLRSSLLLLDPELQI